MDHIVLAHRPTNDKSISNENVLYLMREERNNEGFETKELRISSSRFTTCVTFFIDQKE